MNQPKHPTSFTVCKCAQNSLKYKNIKNEAHIEESTINLVLKVVQLLQIWGKDVANSIIGEVLAISRSVDTKRPKEKLVF